MFPPFPQEIALHYLRVLSDFLDTGECSLAQSGPESEERKNQGIMLGCLVCHDKVSGRRKVLFACSGISKTLVLPENFPAADALVVPPIVPPEKIADALAKNDAEIHSLTARLNEISDDPYFDCPAENLRIKKLRRALTDESLRKVFGLYTFTRFDGKKIRLNKIIQNHNGALPPTGTGDCCAPKLLSFAFDRSLVPVSMAEIFYGKSHGAKSNGSVYPPCDERCAYILPEILGLEILYRDKDIAVVSKSAGLLSVPGRGAENQDSAESRLRMIFPPEAGEGACALTQPAVHRLDMETSGILILAMNKNAHANLRRQFEASLVRKKYIALLDGIFHGKPDGRTELTFRLDVENRPHQIFDEADGKLAVTVWHKCGVESFENPVTKEKRKVTRIEFYPETGRTHQLRLASADCHGLGIPIVGDSLYGKKNEGERLMLHACEVEFIHPRSRKIMRIVSPPDF